MEQISTALMFVGDQYGNAEDAIDLYVSLFEDSRLETIERFGDDEPERGVKHARFKLAGREFVAMDSGGAHNFTFTPSMSLVVEFTSKERVEATFEKLAEGGTILMPLADYGFSRRFGWVNDRYGVSWQLMLVS